MSGLMVSDNLEGKDLCVAETIVVVVLWMVGCMNSILSVCFTMFGILAVRQAMAVLELVHSICSLLARSLNNACCACSALMQAILARDV